MPDEALEISQNHLTDLESVEVCYFGTLDHVHAVCLASSGFEVLWSRALEYEEAKYLN